MAPLGAEMEPIRLPNLASSSSTVTLSQKEIHLFHSIDRQLYTILVSNLWRDPLESMQIMSLWIWLERVGFTQIIEKILSFPHPVITAIADEALACINVLTTLDNPNAFSLFPEGKSGSDIPLTQNLIRREISLGFFKDNKAVAIAGIAKVGSDVCVRALSDLMFKAIELKKAALNKVVQRQKKAEFDESFIKGFMSLGIGNEIGGSAVNVPTDERTMFVTFSKGYPVAEHEVRSFFHTLFGDCIEALYMQEVKSPEDQALYARIVFFDPCVIDTILNGVPKAKFNINGKHVWMRKFVTSKEEDSPSTPPTHSRN